MPTVQSFYLVVPGPPRGQARPEPTVHGRNVRRKTDAQLAYEVDIIEAWRRAGSPRLLPGAFACLMTAWFERPKGHYNRTGFTPAAERAGTWPCVKPDADNLLKQVDVLVAAGAIPDDKNMVRATCSKLWSPRRQDARLHIRFIHFPTYPDTEGEQHGR